MCIPTGARSRSPQAPSCPPSGPSIRARSTRSPNGAYSVPYLLGTEAAQRPAVPAQPTILDIPVSTTEAILEPGHRLRVDIYGPQFDRYLPSLRSILDTGLRPQHILLDSNDPSWINVPIVGAAWR